MRARPPGVVSGLPNMTPIFSRIWLMKIKTHFDRDTPPVSLRRAWLINRACTPTKLSPISPSISARGTRAATESITTMSTALESTSISAICSASSALPGWLTRSASRSTPSRLHQAGSSACSASMNAATPPLRWAWATACSAIVVLPLDSGPNISMIRPRGSPLPPSARSSDNAPVEIPSTSMCEPSPSFMIAPAPNVFSIWLIALFERLLLRRHRRLDLGRRSLFLRHGDRSFPVTAIPFMY